MQLELGRFLKELKVDDEIYTYFNNATLKEAKTNASGNGYILEIENPSLIDINIYERLEGFVKNYVYPCELHFVLTDTSSINELSINVYYLYFIKKMFSGAPIHEVLSKLKLKLINNQMVMILNTRLLQESIEQFKDKLINEFNKAGFPFMLVLQLEKLNDEAIEQLMEQARIEQLKGLNTLQVPSSTVKKEKPHYHKTKEVTISDPLVADTRIHFKGRVFKGSVKTFKDYKPLYSFYVTDDVDALLMTARPSERLKESFLQDLLEKIEDGKEEYVDVIGNVVKDDKYLKDTIVEAKSILIAENPDLKREDNSAEKRVELHLHTNFSTLDGLCSMEKYVDMASKFNHKAIAVTDHGCLQAFPSAQDAGKKHNIKIIYGMEGYVVDEKYEPAYNIVDLDLNKASYVSFDLETTGLSPEYDEIIEIGAVKYVDGQPVDSFQSFVNPKRRISSFTTNLCGITDEDVLGAPLLEEIATGFRKFVGDSVLVAHNAKFDYTFINNALRKRNLPIFTNPVIDTLDLAKCVLPKKKSYSLGGVSRALNVDYDELEAHRADYDATVLGNVLLNLLNIVSNDFHVNNLKDLPSLSPKDALMSMRPHHMTFLVKDMVGLKNLYRIVSESNTKYFNKVPLIPKSLIKENREGLLLGSACFNGEVFDVAKTGTIEELHNIIKEFDYIEIQPLENYSYLLETESVESEERLITILKDIVKVAEEENKIVVATGDCHYLLPRDRIYRDALITWHPKNQVASHPLFDRDGRSKASPLQYFRTTKEMLDGVSYIGENAKKYVIDNPNYIASLISEIKPIEGELKAPKMPGIDVQQEIENITYETAKKIYGDPIPELIKNRLDKELKSLSDNHYAIIYYLAYKLVMKSKSDGYLVGSRGSVGSSLVATMCGITEVNPLPPHYVCPNCHHFEVISDGSYASGFDLPIKFCPECGRELTRNGQNIPFETFLGIHGDKVPDIDLNFSGDYQAKAHEYTKELLDANHVFRAGTISCLQENTAFGVAKNYFEYMNQFDLRPAQYSRVAHYISGVKRTTGQHPGGIVCVPLENDILDFTAVQYPADDMSATWRTTHFTYESMHDELLKLDILGHDDPTALKMLKELTGVDPESIPLNDPKVLSLFTSTDALGVTPNQILSNTGVSGVPEFGTENTKRLLADARPTKYSELVQISGLSHGTGVWAGNAQELVRSGKASLMDCIGCRDDVMTYLMIKGLDPTDSFKIMETVRKKNKFLSDEQKEEMRSHGVPEFYIESADKIEYMFPKAHAVAYVTMALRVAWYKVYYPIEYYATFFSVRCDDFDIETMIKGGDELVNKISEQRNIANDRKVKAAERKKASDLYDVLLLALEFHARGFKFNNISLTKSEAKNFVIGEDKVSLYPAFDTINGLGIEAANTIVEARNDKPFLSQKDLMARTKVNKTILHTLDKMGVLEGLGAESQLSLNLFEE